MDESSMLITGANGQLGRALRERYPGAQATTAEELDITQPDSVANFDWSQVKILVNAAAYTNVPEAETAEGRVAAWKVNATAVGHLAKAANEHDITLVHLST